MDDPETVEILLLGEPDVGKSTLLSRLTQPHASPSDPLPVLHDLDQPFCFSARVQRTPLRLALSDTASPTHYTLQQPDVLVLCFDLARRRTLAAIQTTWKSAVETHFTGPHLAARRRELPVLLLGLKRDRRAAPWTPAQRAWVQERGAGCVPPGEDERAGGDVMPQEGVAVAQALRLDAYAECSARTGELCREVMEDIATLALKAVKGEKGGGLVGAGCTVS